MRRVALASLSVITFAAMLFACWNWDGLRSVRYCDTLDAALFCDDFDDPTIKSSWTNIDLFADKYASLNDAAAISRPQSLLVDYSSVPAGATYYELQIQPSMTQYDIGFWFRLESITGAAAHFFGIEFDLPFDNDAGQYQLWISGGPNAASTSATEKLGTTTLSPEPFADAGIDFPFGEWRYVFLVVDVAKGTLTLRTTSEDASTSEGTITLALAQNLKIASRSHLRLGVFAAEANTTLRERYDNFAVGTAPF